jgi:hypothetical protein
MNERTRSTSVGDRNLGRTRRPSMRLHSTRSSTSSKSRDCEAGLSGLPCRASARCGEALGTRQSSVRDALRRIASEMARYRGYSLTRPTARLVMRQLRGCQKRGVRFCPRSSVSLRSTGGSGRSDGCARRSASREAGSMPGRHGRSVSAAEVTKSLA